MSSTLTIGTVSVSILSIKTTKKAYTNGYKAMSKSESEPMIYPMPGTKLEGKPLRKLQAWGAICFGGTPVPYDAQVIEKRRDVVKPSSNGASTSREARLVAIDSEAAALSSSREATTSNNVQTPEVTPVYHFRRGLTRGH